MVRTPLIAAVAFAAVGLAGCGRIGLGGDPLAASPRKPEPLAAAPTTPVAAAPLQPMLPPGPGEQPPPTTASVDPGAAPSPAAPARQTAAIGRTEVLGGWQISAGGERCRLSTSLTQWTGGYRASTQGCTSPDLQKISAWTLAGNQLVLNGADGSTVATLSQTSPGQLDGQTGSGRPISLTR